MILWKEEQEKESDKTCGKVAKDKASDEDIRNNAIEHLAETKKIAR